LDAALRPRRRIAQALEIGRTLEDVEALRLVEVEEARPGPERDVAPEAQEPRDRQALRDVLAVMPFRPVRLAAGRHIVREGEERAADQAHGFLARRARTGMSPCFKGS